VTKLNLILFFVLIATGLGVITSQHKARKLYIELQQLQDIAKHAQVEWGQLRLEQETWGMPSRVESIAAKSLNMEVPDMKRIQVVTPKQVQDVVKAKQ
jgi:cell division protein FtsL